MNDLTKNLLIIAVILLIPIVPFIGFGREIEAFVDDWAKHAPSPGITAAAIVGLLAADIFLPIPSSFVSTFGGAHLGTLWGTVASSLGMSIGAILGFFLARVGGRPLARKWCSAESLDNMHALSERYGPLVLVLTRAVPVFAEASVLIVGIHRLSWRGFLPPIIVTNLGLALAYSA